MFALKVAVAVAIIKSKPENISIQDYTTSLQRKFMLKQSQLENDYAEAKLKISDLEKQIAKSRTQSKKVDAVNDGEIVQILTPPSSDSSQNKIHATLAEFGDSHKQEMTTFESENSRFIQSVVSLQNVASSLQIFKNGDDIDLSIPENISNVSEILSRDVIALPESSLCKAAEAITSLLHRYPTLENCDQTMEAVFRLIETVLLKIKSPSNLHQFPPHRQKHSLMQMLLNFMKTSSPHLSMIVLDSLMDTWEEFCHGLRNSRKTQTPLDPQAFNSSFFIIRTTELTVKLWTESQRCCLDPATLHNLQERLENSLLHLTHFFPLVAQTVWKVTALIESILQGYQTRLS